MTAQQCDLERHKFFHVFGRKLFKHVAKFSTAPKQKKDEVKKEKLRQKKRLNQLVNVSPQ